MTKVNFYDDAYDSLLQFAVIIAKHNGKWVFCKHKERSKPLWKLLIDKDKTNLSNFEASFFGYQLFVPSGIPPYHGQYVLV